MFMDVRGFTAWSETQSPETVAAFVNDLYQGAEEILHLHHALKYKFTGDEVMALFAQSADAYTTFVRAAGTTSDGRVQGAGLTGRRGPEAEVLVFATVDLVASPQAAARSTDFRLRVVVADEAGVFKLAKVQYLP